MYRNDIETIIDLVILKQVEEKCSRVETMYSNGSAPSIRFNEDGEVETLTYEDGTEIHFNERGDITHFRNADGVEMDYLFDDAYKFFESQKEAIIDKYGDEGWEFLKTYSDMYATAQGIKMNEYLRGLCSFDEFKDFCDNRFWNSKSSDDFSFLWGNHDRFIEMLSTMDLPNNFYSVRVMNHVHDNDSLDKSIVSDKAHMNSTAGAKMRGSLFEGPGLDLFADVEFGWKVITDFSGSHNAKGLFLGSALYEKRGGDWEMEVNHAPGQKFERVLVDEEHKIIVQRPYNP